MRELPMFPLGSVLFPHMVLPLHVFEPRYRVLVRRVLDGDGEFGVTLIERGHEVGGGDARTDVGTVARVVKAEELDDGRWLVIAVGTRRLRVVEWLRDDPHPRALVEELDEPPAGPDARALLAVVERKLRRVLALLAELDERDVPPVDELERDPTVASYQAAVLSGAGPLDAQRLLTTPDADARLAALSEVLDATEEVLRFRLGADPTDPDEA